MPGVEIFTVLLPKVELPIDRLRKFAAMVVNEPPLVMLTVLFAVVLPTFGPLLLPLTAAPLIVLTPPKFTVPLPSTTTPTVPWMEWIVAAFPPVEIAGVPVSVRVLPVMMSPVTLQARPVAEIGAVRVTVLEAAPPKTAVLPLVQRPPKLASVVFQLPVAAPLSQVGSAAFATTANRVSNTSNTAPANEWVKRLTNPADWPPERPVAAKPKKLRAICRLGRTIRNIPLEELVEELAEEFC